MAAQGATLQTQLLELCSCMEEVQQRRAELLISTREEEAERARVSQDLAALQRRLAQLDAGLERKKAGREALERVIGQAQAALDKLAESSGLCLAVTRRNAQEVGCCADHQRKYAVPLQALSLTMPDLRDTAA
ncbi:hypothetical protein COHA_001709 [Chlorella ohadii]|uniref:Uncharacterized protein n=1 Tax=Chlorella ohadii TaxID=2649997 RepID=A0AAD5DY85_9CHLO|nr:hypothetical protein COHA_001709 [Chlorella ohadii]